MLMNKARRRTAESAYYQIDPYDVPGLLSKARQNLVDNLREADRRGNLNEFYGPDEINLEYLDDEEDVDFSEMNTCAGIVWMATYRVVDSLRQIFTKYIYRSPNSIDLESGEIQDGNLAPYSFDLGPHTRHFQNSAMANAPQIGGLLTYKVVLSNGTELDVLEVQIPDRGVHKILFEPHREIQAEILTEKCASLLWLFQGRTQIILVTESSNPHAWTPQQWFRKILSDMALADSIMIGHPYYWHPVVKRRLSKALKHFKKLYKTIADQERVIKAAEQLALEGSDSSPRVHPDKGKLKKTEVLKYKSNGKDFVKAMEYYPHTRTRILIGNYSSEKVSCRPMEDILGNLHENWGQYNTNIKKNKQFPSLKKLVEMEEKEREEYELSIAKKNEEIEKALGEIGDTQTSESEPNTPLGLTYRELYEKSVLGSGPGLVEVVLEKKGVNSASQCSRDDFQVIKSADMNVKTNYMTTNGTSPSKSEKHWKDSVYSQSENGTIVGFSSKSSNKAKSKCHKSSSKRHQQGPSRSEGHIPKTDDQESLRSRSKSPYPESVHDQPEPTSSKKSSRRQHEGKPQTSELEEVHGAPQEPWDESSENVLKLGLSKTRHRIERGSGSATEVGPPMAIFNEPNAMEGHVFGFGIPQQDFYHASEIPPADADSLSVLAPHGLNSREGLTGVVDQLDLETHMITPTHGHPHPCMQQHRCGSGTRNACNLGAYHAVTHNKSLESLDLGQPNPNRQNGIPIRPRGGRGKANGNRCSQCHLEDNPQHQFH